MIVFRDQRIPFFFFWITFLLPGSAPGQLFSSRDTAVANAHPWKRETGSSVLDSSTCAKSVVFSSLRGVDMYKNLFLVGVFKCKKTVLAAGHAVWWSLRIVYFHLFGKTVFPKKMGKNQAEQRITFAFCLFINLRSCASRSSSKRQLLWLLVLQPFSIRGISPLSLHPFFSTLSFSSLYDPYFLYALLPIGLAWMLHSIARILVFSFFFFAVWFFPLF